MSSTKKYIYKISGASISSERTKLSTNDLKRLMSGYQGQRKDEGLVDGETNSIKHKISNQDGDLSKTTLGSSKQWSNVFKSLRENDFSQFLHLATLSIKNEGRKKTCTNIQDFKNFTSHETFLGTLLEDVLTKMKGQK